MKTIGIINKEKCQEVIVEVERDYAIAAKRKLESSIRNRLGIENHIAIEGFDCDSTVMLVIRFIGVDGLDVKVQSYIGNNFELMGE